MSASAQLTATSAHPRSRRAMLAGALGGIAALVAGAARVDVASAAQGGPILMGRINRAEGTSTQLHTKSNGPTFFAAQHGGGVAMRAESDSGRALIARSGVAGNALWARSQSGVAVLADTQGGPAVKARSTDGTAVEASGGEIGLTAVGTDYAVQAISGTTAIYASGATSGYFVGRFLLIGPMDFNETIMQDAPSSGARMFARDNGSGKTELCVRFASGAVQVLATEP